ncbi:MAG: AAA family ATPase [Bacillaceae bacterium]|nr:AAA family ATPase [Bacillaceae bacterium]
MDAYQVYPFSAIVGQERVKQALLMNIVNAKLGGLLICGERGTAKSTLVRAIVKLVNNKKVIELPLNTTEEMVVGTVNVETAIKHGKGNWTKDYWQKQMVTFFI